MSSHKLPTLLSDYHSSSHTADHPMTNLSILCSWPSDVLQQPLLASVQLKFLQLLTLHQRALVLVASSQNRLFKEEK